jgi:DNA-binding MarR family transcriptional regulator
MKESPDSENLNHLLVHVCRAHYVRTHELLEKIGLYRGQPPLFKILWKHEGLSHSELAAKLEISLATTTKMVQRLEKGGFLERRPDPKDQRLSRVYLTEDGHRIRSEVEAVWDEMEEETFAGLSHAEKVQLAKMLSQVRENLVRENYGK